MGVQLTPYTFLICIRLLLENRRQKPLVIGFLSGPH